MYLLLDNSDAQQIVLSLWLDNVWVQRVYQSKEFGLIGAIDKCFQEEKCVLKDLGGIAVVVGRGSFTSTRIAVTVANTLSYALGISVVATSSIEEIGLVDKIKNAKKDILVSAVYSGEPNIGKKRI